MWSRENTRSGETKMRLAGKNIVVFGGGQMPGGTIGNGRATCILFAREGANVLVVDDHDVAPGSTAVQAAAAELFL